MTANRRTMTALWVVAGVCFATGAVATARWLPELREGSVGFIALFVISGLGGAAIAAIGIHIDLIVRTLETGGEPSQLRVVEVGGELTSLLFESGILAALAMTAYFVAPKPKRTPATGP